jgi:hypothetical protein
MDDTRQCLLQSHATSSNLGILLQVPEDLTKKVEVFIFDDGRCGAFMLTVLARLTL